ncbi:MAG: CocE/NonD family hydrolase C-terminal non-catalytic domain-containing protein [Actinomycetota bacterium]
MFGTASADLWISSTAPDTDLEVLLTEVRPDGQEVFVQKGWLRASHRLEDARFSRELRPFQSHRIGDSAPLVPGHPSLARVEIFPFAHAFRAGSKVRISVQAPNILPDLWGFASLPLPAINTIHTSEFYPSSIALPVMDGVEIPTDYPVCGSLRNQPCRPEPAA